MKVILCKPDKAPEIVELAEDHNYKDILKLLEIESPLTCVRRRIGTDERAKFYDLWCDDEGLLQDKKYICGACSDVQEVICGNIVIAKNDGNGNTIGLDDDELKAVLSEINWVPNAKFIEFVERHEVFKYPSDENGDRLIISDYNGFGQILMKPSGFMLRYTVE